MEDKQLHLREAAHRQMLIASGRSKPAPSKGPRAGGTPGYVYPPKGPAPPVLPPLPDLPTLTPLIVPPELGEAKMFRLLMLWDFCNMFGESFKLKPREMPLDALVNCICGQTATDLALAVSLITSMMRALARDLIHTHLDPPEIMAGWEPWLCACADENLLPILWPHLLGDLLEGDASYSSWNDTYAASDRLEVLGILRTREWDGLTPAQRLDVLGFLSENTAQCQTVRSHLEKNFDSSMNLMRDRKQALEEEASKEKTITGCQQRIDGMENRIAEWKAQQAQRAQARKRPIGTCPNFDEELGGERTKKSEEETALGELRGKRFEVQSQLDSMPVRSEPMGRDRHGRAYVSMGGAPTSNALFVYTQNGEAATSGDNAEDDARWLERGFSGLNGDGKWSWLEGGSAIKQLFHALHPDGKREGVLLSALRNMRYASVHYSADSPDDALPLHPASALPKDLAAAANNVTQQYATWFKANSQNGAIEPIGYRPSDAAGSTLSTAQRLQSLAQAIACGDDVADAKPAVSSKTPGSGHSKEARAQARVEKAIAKAEDAEAKLEEAASPVAATTETPKVEEGEEAATVTPVAAPAPPPPPPPPPPTPKIVSEAVAALAMSAKTSRPYPPVRSHRLACSSMRSASSRSGTVWVRSRGPSAHASVRVAWDAFLRSATHPAECAAALRVLDAHLAPTSRSRIWGVERADRWRNGVMRATTIAVVALYLIVLDDASAWDSLERTRAASAAPGTKAPAAVATKVRPKMGPLHSRSAATRRVTSRGCSTARPRHRSTRYARPRKGGSTR